MGKTNLLEAIYYLCMTKSPAGLNDRHLALHEQSFFRLEGHFTSEHLPQKIVAKVVPGKSKVMECNDVAYEKLSQHIGLLPVVMIAPDDTALLTGASEDRRRLMDNVLSQLSPDYLRNLLLYNNLLQQRNAALKQMAASGQYNELLLETYEHRMEPAAQVIFQHRQSWEQQLLPYFLDYYRDISGGAEMPGLLYQSQLQQQPLADWWRQHREKDRILHRTSAGVHRDDVLFSLDGQEIKRFASQGQLKSFLLALKLAQYELLRAQKKRPPLLLLDDIFDKLDPHRVKHLLTLLVERSYGQIFLTDTDEDRVARIAGELNTDYQAFKIANGHAQQQ